MQMGIADVLEDEELYLSLGKQMQAKRDFFSNALLDTPFKALPSSGSYFQCFSYAGFSGLPDTEFVINLVKDYGVAAIPLSAFYHDGTDNKTIRFCFAKKEETLTEAAIRLGRTK